MRFLALILSVVLLSACSTKVERMDSSETIDLSGAWNDSDSRMTAETMVADVLNRPWINRHVSRTGKQPTVIVGNIKNLSHEHINTNTFISDIERELINSGMVEFVASANQRGEIREERKDQDLNATEATRNAAGQEIGADYMLSGQINTIIDVDNSTQVRYYQVDLTLISMADNRKVWIGQEKIKKLVENSKLRY
ncbi:penicillin-binding protein activator LpoB [Colwelliaceae bacterium MEBiC 14330]